MTDQNALVKTFSWFAVVYLVFTYFFGSSILSYSALSKVAPYFKLGLIVFVLKLWFYDQEMRQKNTTLAAENQTEIQAEGPLLDREGRLVQAGWSRKPVKKFTPDRIGGLFFGFKTLNALRVKMFEYYSFLYDQKLVQIGVGNVGYGASMFVNVFDFETLRFDKFAETMMPVIDSKRFPQLAGNPFECQTVSYEFKKGDYLLAIEQSEDKKAKTHKSVINIRVSNLVVAQLTSQRDLTQEDHFEASHSSEHPNYFYYNLKSYDNRWSGNFTIRGDQHHFQDREGLGMCDFGRGVFPYKTNWIWGSAYGRLTDGRTFGFNLGGGIGITPSSVEDYFKLDGKIHKLNPVVINYSPGQKVDLVQIRSNPDLGTSHSYADVTFTPVHTAQIGENLLVIVSNFKYVYGLFSGRVVDESGLETRFTGLKGMIEWGRFKW